MDLVHKSAATVRALALAAAALAAAPASAIDVADGKLLIDGFGAMGYGRTSEGAYSAGSEDGSYDNANFALAITAKPTERLVVAGQFFSSAGETEVDWAFAEWRFSDALRFRAGKIKTPLGIYTEVLDVGTVRPFFTLPTSIYGPSGIAPEAFQGAGITGRLPLGRWALSYDVYGGSFESERLEAYEILESPGPITADAWQLAATAEDEETLDSLGLRLRLQTPIDGLDVMVSSYRGKPAGEDAHETYGLSVAYDTDRLWIRAEGFRLHEDEATSLAGYLELACFVTSRLQLAARADWMKTDLEGFSGDSSLLRHADHSLGVNWWFTREFVVKASYHDVRGNRFALPESAESAAEFEGREAHSNLVVLGAQFSF